MYTYILCLYIHKYVNVYIKFIHVNTYTYIYEHTYTYSYMLATHIFLMCGGERLVGS